MEILQQLRLAPDTFDGRIAVVTGGARGIGAQVAWALAHLGAHVIILDKRELGSSVAEDIVAKGGSAEFMTVDLADAVWLEATQSEILARHERVDVLVNNASRLVGVAFLEAPLSLWDELYRTTVRASASLICAFLPVMQRNRCGVICNTVAAEGLSWAGYFSSAMVGQRSMILSLAGEIDADDGVSVLGFAPGVVDTPLVREDTESLRYYGMSLDEWAKFVDNPGYEGLMPVEHCGASYAYCLAHARAYHGQIADAFHPLINYGVVTRKTRERDQPDAYGDNISATVLQCSQYVQGISSVNRNLEIRIKERTAELEAANGRLADQNRLIEDLSQKLARYLPKQVYQSIFSGQIEANLQSRRRRLTVFFSDICDFTRKSERLEPEALSEVLNTYFSAMTEIARDHGATIDKFIGDAILAFFGDPESHGPSTDAARCVEMAIEMQRCMRRLAPEFARLGLSESLQIRIGINTGYCTVGNFGSFERLDYTIIGSPVNLAARLQQQAEPGTILVSDATRALVAERFEFASRGALNLKGIPEAVPAFEIRMARDQPNSPTADPVAVLTRQLAEIDIDQLGEAERAGLMQAMTRLLAR